MVCFKKFSLHVNIYAVFSNRRGCRECVSIHFHWFSLCGFACAGNARCVDLDLTESIFWMISAAINKARGAAAKLYETIDCVLDIDSSDPSGLKPEDVRGEIIFVGVTFTYPSCSDVPRTYRYPFQLERPLHWLDLLVPENQLSFLLLRLIWDCSHFRLRSFKLTPSSLILPKVGS